MFLEFKTAENLGSLTCITLHYLNCSSNIICGFGELSSFKSQNWDKVRVKKDLIFPPGWREPGDKVLKSRRPCSTNLCIWRRPCSTNVCIWRRPCSTNLCIWRRPCSTNLCIWRRPCSTIFEYGGDPVLLIFVNGGDPVLLMFVYGAED